MFSYLCICFLFIILLNCVFYIELSRSFFEGKHIKIIFEGKCLIVNHLSVHSLSVTTSLHSW